MIYQLRLTRVTPSLNQWQRASWRLRHNALQDWTWDIRAAMSAAGYFGRPELTRVSLAIERRVRAQKHLIQDQDNLEGGLKPLMDGLVRAGMLKDDSMKVVLSRTIAQVVTGELGDQVTWVQITEVPK